MKKVLANLKDQCYNRKWSFLKGGLKDESKIIRKTDLREMQSHQEKGTDQNYLRESEA